MSAMDNRKLENAKDNLAYQEKRKIEDMNNKLKLENRVKNEIFTKNNFGTPQNQKLMAENAPKPDTSRLSNFSFADSVESGQISLINPKTFSRVPRQTNVSA